jgi:hypothetical protein
MKNLTTIAFALLTPMALFRHTAEAQTDTTTTQEGNHQVEFKVSSKEGLKAGVFPTDTVHKDDPDTLTFQTRRKTYTIITRRRLDEDTVTFDKNDDEQALRRQRRNLFTYWSGLDLGLNNLLSPDGTLDRDSSARFMELNMSRSRFFAINFMEQKIEFGSHHAGLMTGLGIEFTSYHLENNQRLMFNSDSTWAVDAEPLNLTKNKLRQIGLRVPLMLEFNTGRAEVVRKTGKTSEGKVWTDEDMTRKNNFHLAFGVIGSLYFDTMYKVKYEQDGETKKDRNGGSFNLEPYRLAASVRVGWNSLNLFAEYSLTDLFKKDRGPELTPVNIGITLVGFN